MHEVSQPLFIGDLNMKLEQAVKEIRAALEASGLISNQVIMDSLNIIENQPNHLSYIEPGKTYVVKINAELFSEDLISYLGSEFDGEFCVSWTATDPEFQGCGFCSRILKLVFNKIRSMGAKSIVVETYEHPKFYSALIFYRKLGFKLYEFTQDYLKDGSSVFYMRKNL